MLAILYGTGAVLCLYILVLGSGPSDSGFCELFKSDCASVLQSEFAAWSGFPVASFGLGYFVMQFALVAAGFLQRRDGRGHHWTVVFANNLIGAAAGLYFIYLLTTVLKEFCLLCSAVHLVNFLALAIAGRHILLHKGRPEPRKIAASLTVGPVSFALLLSLVVFLGANLHATRNELVNEKKNLGENLGFSEYQYRNSPYRQFAWGPDEEIVGDRRRAVHEIVLFYKDGCKHCKKAREKLVGLVQKYPREVYLVLKNTKEVPPELLKELQIDRVPEVFINGKRAAGWDIPGFLDKYTEDCDC